MSPVAFSLKVLIRAYQWFISPILGAHCRHWPSCSAYAVEAVETHGAVRGAWLAARRLARCHPWGTAGVDPVPLIDSNAGPMGLGGRGLSPSSPRALGDGSVGRARAPRGNRAMIGGKDGRAADPAIPARPAGVFHGR